MEGHKQLTSLCLPDNGLKLIAGVLLAKACPLLVELVLGELVVVAKVLEALDQLAAPKPRGRGPAAQTLCLHRYVPTTLQALDMRPKCAVHDII